MEILEPLLHPSISKNKIVTKSWLHPSASQCFFFTFLFVCFFCLPFPSSSVACYCCVTKIFFEKRNVHECLQCPPHWNTWGEVSSLTLWSKPAPHLEPQHLVPPLPRIFFSWDDGQFSCVSLWHIWKVKLDSELVGPGVVLKKKKSRRSWLMRLNWRWRCGCLLSF